jgi:7,8-dihydroneopterin aldolase/epimerase/oxygenase
VDRIVIKDLDVDAHVGATKAERARAQRLLITVELECDLAAAGRTDRVASTTRYDVVADMIRTVATGCPHKLVEAVAEEIAEVILARKMALAVTVEVKKFSIPRSQYVSIQIHRAR